MSRQSSIGSHPRCADLPELTARELSVGGHDVSAIARWQHVSDRGRLGLRTTVRSIAPMRFLVLLLIAVVTLSGCSGRPAADASGPEIYSQLCARCHGADLGGGIGPALGAGSDLVDRTDEYIEGVLRGGRGSMPAFGNTLDDVQIDRLIGFLRSEQTG